MSETVLRFTYDCVCPYAWIASTQVEALAARHGARVEWDPVLLGGIFQALEAPAVPAESWAPAKAVLGHKDVHRQAELAGLDLRFPAAHPRRTVDAMRLCTVAGPQLRPAVTAALYRAYWTEGRDLSDPETVNQIAVQHGIPIDSIRAPETKQALRERTAAAVERGVFGVPSLQVFRDGAAVGPVHWGSDRLHFVEQDLAGTPGDLSLPAVAGAPPSRITLFHDFASPYAYLGVTQAARIAETHGAELVLAPILLGALFRQIGTPMVPLFAMNPAKQQWYSAELGRWAAWWGVDFSFPSCFPVRTVAPLRAALVEPALTLPLYRALWVEGKNIGEQDVLEEVIATAGHDPEAIMAATQRPELKAQLKANTARAEQLGVVGVPSYLVERTGTSSAPEDTPPVRIWGQDRTVQLERVLQGWTPAGAGR